MEMRVALAQMEIALADVERNLATAQAMAAQATAKGADLLVLPELWATGYDLAKADAYAAALGQGAFGLMADMAKETGLYVTGTALEENPQGLPYNTAAMYRPNGLLAGSYQKIHLWAPFGEVEHMTAGVRSPVFDLPWGQVALAVCYDLRFPELWRRYADGGAQLVVIPAEWPVRRVEHWRLLLRARAVENQYFVAGCNRAGTGPDGEFGGHSAAVDPWAQVLVEGGDEQGLFVATLELDEVARSRRLFPFLQDRRPEVYGR